MKTERNPCPTCGAHPESSQWHSPEVYPWVVREPSGQLWGPFPTNKAAGDWAEKVKIDTCDFEDVMPPYSENAQCPRSDGPEA